MRVAIAWAAILSATAWAPLAGTTAQAQSTPVPSGVGTHVSTAPLIDGDLRDEVWGTADPLTDFIQNEPFDGQPASERTEVRIVFDDEAIYLGAWMFDQDPSGIVLGETRRDANISDTDALVVIFDTFLDRQNGFLFGTTPAGIEYDGQVTKEGQGGGGGPGGPRQQAGSGGGFNLNWDGSWEVAASRDDAGWYAEFRIPFSTLRYGRGGEQVWGLNISRNLRRRNEQAFWAPVPRQFDIYRVSQAGTLTGIEAPARRTVSVTPYALGRAQRDYVDGTEMERSAEFGGDVKVGLTPSLTLDMTYNTDFAQVEVDDQQVNLTRFQLFFPEKRPFFLENAGTFSVGSPQSVDLFFSRRIGLGPDNVPVPIVAGGRVTGKVGGVTVGLLNLQTEDVTGFVSPNNFGVVRIAQELPNRTRLGGVFVSRLNTDNSSDYNLTYGVDGRLGIGEAWTFDGYAAKTQTPALTGGEYAGSLSASYTTRDWRLSGSAREVGENFNPEVGFLPRSAYRFANFRILRAYRIESIPWFRELRPHVSYQSFWGLDGANETRLIHIDSHFEFSNGAFFQLPAINFTREGLRDPFEISDGVFVPSGVYDNLEWGFAYNSNLSAPVSFQGRITIGGFFSGHRKGISNTLNFRAGDTFAAGLRVDYNDVDLREGSFNTSLVGVRFAYSFTPRIYLQSLVQYNNRTDNLSSNIRLGWLNTAGTGLFIVYNDIERIDSSTLDADDRAFIIKFTQLFQLAN